MRCTWNWGKDQISLHVYSHVLYRPFVPLLSPVISRQCTNLPGKIIWFSEKWYGINKLRNFKDFSRPNKEIKYFSRTLTEFKDFSRRLLKFKTFSRLYEPCLRFTEVHPRSWYVEYYKCSSFLVNSRLRAVVLFSSDHARTVTVKLFKLKSERGRIGAEGAHFSSWFAASARATPIARHRN